MKKLFCCRKRFSKSGSINAPSTVGPIGIWNRPRCSYKTITSATNSSLAAQKILAQLWAVRAPGLWRLLHIVEEESGVPSILELLRTWADHSTKILREARGLERRYLGHRDWFYHNLANNLCRRYQQISIVTRDPEGAAAGPALNASSYHHLLAPSRFVTFLRQAAGKTGTEVRMQPQRPIASEGGVNTKSVERPSSAVRKLKHIVKSVA